MTEREAELRTIGAATLYDMEIAGRVQGARLLVYDPDRDAFFFKADDTFALSRHEANFEFLAKYAIWL